MPANETPTAPQQPRDIRRIVVKFGTASLTLPNARLNEPLIRAWVDALSDLLDRGIEIVVVSSGAIGAGMGELNLTTRPESLPDKQALAAVGQALLVGLYGDAFRKRGYHAAQVLLTRGDLDDRQRYLNIRNCLQTLLARKIVPIINENDTVAVEELTFSDNDTLSAMIAVKMQADMLGIFTNVAGLYAEDPRTNPDARVVPVVKKITPEIEAMAGIAPGSLGRGGMRSKILAAQAATRAGVPVAIVSGDDPKNIARLLAGESVGTLFEAAQAARLSTRHSWMALGANTATRRLHIDEGAARALTAGKKSLLAAGIRSVEGVFQQGDVVELLDTAGRCIAKGLSNYSSNEIAQIHGKKSADIAAALGEKRYDEVVHRDNMVMLE